MRIGIREQLTALVLLTSLCSLAVITIASWLTNYNRIIRLRTEWLGLTASLKAAQLSANLDVMQRSVRALSTRVRLQNTLQAYNNGNRSAALFSQVSGDLTIALGGGSQEVLTLQAMVFSNNKNDSTGTQSSLLNITGNGVNVTLPYTRANGTTVYLGDSDLGYPPDLYPNITYAMDENDLSVASFAGMTLVQNSSILLGPWQVNSSFSLASITLPIINNTSATNILGWLTVVEDARLISQVLDSPVGLDNTGTMLLVTPNTVYNRFPGKFINDTLPITFDLAELEQTEVRFGLPPIEPYNTKRHALRDHGTQNPPFGLTAYSAVISVMAENQDSINNAGGQISTRNEEGYKVSVGYAVPSTSLCTWALIVEQAQSEVWIPIDNLRRVLLACIFGTFGAVILLVFPIAHYSSRPIRRLRDATAKSLRPPPTDHGRDMTEKESDGTGSDPSQGTESTVAAKPQEKSLLASVMPWSRKKDGSTSANGAMDPEALKQVYPIPQNVAQRKHLISDELTDLTHYFNEMSDELVLHYGRLEERVRQRTAELEASKIAAEAANESKTLFIANISHELKTPLNGILGMCAVCMQENDPARIRRSLEIIYKSGDLLHNLLTDLLTFSKNQAGQQLTLDEKEFHLRDIGTQVMAIFENQAKEGNVQLSVAYVGPRDGLTHGGLMEKSYGPLGAGRVKDMYLWGDYQRILQVVINLISNSLKFTPANGTVKLTIKCGEEITTEVPLSRRGSEHSSTKSGGILPRLRMLTRKVSDGEKNASDDAKTATDNSTELRKRESQSSAVADSVAATGPLGGSTYQFEFEVEDTGPGIAENLQQKIFEPFVQGDLRLTKKFGGTGLGLSICQQLSKLMHGSIGLDSELGKGSRFTLSIPLKHIRTRADSSATSIVDYQIDPHSRKSSVSTSRVPSRTQSPDPAGAAAAAGLNVTTATTTAAATAIQNSPMKSSSTFEADSKPRLVGLSQPFFSTAAAPMSSLNSDDNQKKGSKLKVLVAEDNKVNQEVVLRMLKLEEIFDVHVAKDGQEALDFVKASMEAQSPYDLIFMDVQMPNLDGRQSTRLIREIGYSAPIVALTAFADEINQKECMDSGMDYFLAKPIRRPALKHVLKTYCQPIEEEEGEEGRTPSGTVGGGVSTSAAAAASASAPTAAGKAKQKSPTMEEGFGGDGPSPGTVI